MPRTPLCSQEKKPGPIFDNDDYSEAKEQTPKGEIGSDLLMLLVCVT